MNALLKWILPWLLCVPLLASCKASEKPAAVPVDLLEAYSLSRPEALALLRLADSDFQSSSGVDLYETEAVWCGKKLPTTLAFQEDVPRLFQADAERKASSKTPEELTGFLSLFEAQFTRPKSIAVVDETGSGKSLEYSSEQAMREIQAFCEAAGPREARFTFSLSSEGDDCVLAEFVCRKTGETPEKILISYSIQNLPPPLEHTLKKRPQANRLEAFLFCVENLAKPGAL